MKFDPIDGCSLVLDDSLYSPSHESGKEEEILHGIAIDGKKVTLSKCYLMSVNTFWDGSEPRKHVIGMASSAVHRMPFTLPSPGIF